MKFVKLFSLLLLLIVPVILWFGLFSLSAGLLKATSLYSQPLEITHTWAARRLGSIKGVDLEKDNIMKFPITVSNVTLTIITEVSRAPKGEKEEKEIAGAAFWECSKGLHKKDMIKEMLRPSGHKRIIRVKEGALTSAGKITNAILISFISFISIMLYYPIITKIVRFSKNK